ncbi:MAG: hypothetical protein ACRDXB_18170 [Actinomycetes bacterium]
MASHQTNALRDFSASLGCVAVSVLFVVAGLWPLSLISLYVATLLLWSGWRQKAKAERREAEIEWWARAKKGIEQDPLNPCCLQFDDTGHLHDETVCTRYRYRRPRQITREERIEIDREWQQIISRLHDPEYGEEA